MATIRLYKSNFTSTNTHHTCLFRPFFVNPSLSTRRNPHSSFTAICAAQNGSKKLTIIHFNDVYDISPRTIEPVGGAARFSTLVQQYKDDNPLILFSGDCLNPSLLSAFTRGEQMVPVLNGIGVHAAALGNHEFDFGVEILQQRIAQFNFPWLLSNVLDIHTHKPLAGVKNSIIIEWNSISVGLIALVEKDWLLTIPSIEADRDIIFLDPEEEGRRLANELRDQGADIVIALTHMRRFNDELLASAVPEIQLLLGGHDHDYHVAETSPHGTLLVKSGTDFREFSVLQVHLENDTSASTGEKMPTIKRPRIECERIEVTKNIIEDPQMASLVSMYQNLMGTRMDQPLGRTFFDLDARFQTVRCRESNLGNLLGDIMRLALGVDVAFLNGGTVRSDQIHAAGRLTMRDFVSMLPFQDELVALRLSGEGIKTALETGVSSWPKLEGRFLQVSGLSFTFDPNRPPGSRIVSVTMIDGTPLDPEKEYTIATKQYLRSGKDGFESLRNAEVVIDGETAPRLATLVLYLLTRIEELNEENGTNSDIDSSAHSSCSNNSNSSNGSSSSSSSSSSGDDGDACCNSDEIAISAQKEWKQSRLCGVMDAPQPPPPCAHGLDTLYVYDVVTGQFGVAPMVEGRVVRLD